MSRTAWGVGLAFLFCVSLNTVRAGDAEFTYEPVLGCFEETELRTLLEVAEVGGETVPNGYFVAIEAVTASKCFFVDVEYVSDVDAKYIREYSIDISVIEVAYGTLIERPVIAVFESACGHVVYVAIDFLLDEHLIGSDNTKQLQLTSFAEMCGMGDVKIAMAIE